MGTGGKIRQLGISKRGDPYIRTLLMHGAGIVRHPGARSCLKGGNQRLLGKIFRQANVAH
jgi:transposase